MKKLVYQASALLTATALAACGRPSTSNFFGLDGVGPPGAELPGNPIPGKFGGTISLTNWDLLTPSYGEIFGASQIPFHQAYFNAQDIAGLGGWDLLVIATPAPLRLNGLDSRCYMDPITLPALGGPIESRDVGERLDFDAEATNPEDDLRMRLRRDDDRDYSNPTRDTLLWLTGNPDYNQDGFINSGDFVPGNSDVTVEWEGGTLDNKGFAVAPEFELDDPMEFPTIPRGPGGMGYPTVNGVPISATPVEEDDEYRIRWEPTVGGDDHLLGMEIILTVYGPTNFEEAPAFDYFADNPYFNRLAHMVCLVDDDEGEFRIYQSEVDEDETDPHSPFTIDELVAMAKATGKYAVSTEDANGNGVLDVIENGCGPPTSRTDCVEDGNGNNVIDRIYGIALTVNRRSELAFDVPLGGGKDTTILLVGNQVQTTKMATYSAPSQCNNGIDDDGDGFIDFPDDPGCSSEWDNTEASQCQNGIDDDGDGFIDFPDDPQCTDEHDDDESS